MNCCSIVELREYTMQPVAREIFANLFDREFIETQEEWGIHVIGQFLDVDRPDRFVWMRGFRSMESRRQALTSFYDGPVWAEHCDAANAAMIDSDNVLLLHPAHSGSGFAHPPGSRQGESGVYAVTVTDIAVGPASNGALANFVTEKSQNSYPRLPIREGEDVWVAVRRYDSLNEVPRDSGSGLTMRLTPTLRSALR